MSELGDVLELLSGARGRYTPEELAELAVTLVPAAKERPPHVE